MYNLPLGIRLAGALNVEALHRSLNMIMRRHTALRTTFSVREEQPVQTIAPPRDLPLAIEELSSHPIGEREAAALSLAKAEARRPFDLATDLLMRAALLRLDATDHLLVLTLHHIVSDGWSLDVLFREISALYEAYATGVDPLLPELPVRFADFAMWQRQWFQGAELERQLSYWRQQLADVPAVLDLPADNPRPLVQTFQGAAQPIVIAPALTEALRRLSQREGVTLFMTILAAFQALLFRYTGQADIVVGSPIAGRVRVDVENLIGFFVNTLLMRTNLAGDPTFRELLGRVRRVSLDAYAHQDVPFEKLVEELQPERTLDRNPLFQVEMILQKASQPAQVAGLMMTPIEISNGTSKFDLTLSLEETPSHVVGVLEYNADLFEATTIERLVGHFQALLEGIVANPGGRVSALPLLTAAEQTELLHTRNLTAAPYPHDLAVHHFVEQQVARTPDAPAVVFGQTSLSYRELDQRATQLAYALLQQGVGRGVRVGVCLERSPEMLVALLAIFKAGGAFVPLDPAFPPERLTYIAQDAQLPLLLTQQRLLTRLSALPARPLAIDTDWPSIAQAPVVALPQIDGSDLAYLIYTSGSTGRPKGVLIPHSGIVNYLVWCAQAYHADAGRGAPVHASIAADAIFPSLFAPLFVGRSVVVFPQEQALEALGDDLLAQGQFSFIKITPSQLEVLNYRMPQRDATGWVDTLVVGAEAVRSEVLQYWQRHAPTTVLLNEYGPTETVVGCSIYPVLPDSRYSGVLPIGLPIANLRFYVLDRAMRPLPIGVPGELYIGGDGVAWGYLNRPGLTAEKFVPDPFSGEAGARLYRSGDVVRYLDERAANIAFLGRRDDQVKIRGYRVELGEIEALLDQHPLVREVVVLAREERPGQSRLVAYVVPDQEQRTKPVLSEVEGNKEQNGEKPDSQFSILNSQFSGELRDYLKERLPEYMVPAVFMLLEQMPLAPHGKIDRQRLPLPEVDRGGLEEAFVAPRTPLEAQMAAIWSQVLGSPELGVHDNFFALGGHSLMATQVMTRVRSAFEVELPLRALFEAPTVAGLAARISLAQTEASVLPPIRPVPRNPDPSIRQDSAGRGDIPLPLSFAQQRLWFLDQLNPDSAIGNVYNAYRVTGALDRDALLQSLQGLIARHESLRTTFVSVDGQVRQVIAPPSAPPLSVVDLRTYPQVERETRVRSFVLKEAQQPFDLANGPLMRVALLQLNTNDHVLVLTLHHIICDEWSLSKFFDELDILYRAACTGTRAELPPQPIQYADFAAWQQQWLQGPVLERQMAYWKQRLEGAPPILELPADHARPAIQSYRGDMIDFELPASLAAALTRLSQREGVTLFMTLLAAFQTLILRYTGQTDIVVGSPIAGRTRREVEELIGPFINTLVLRSDLSGNPAFLEVLRRVREIALDAYAHQDLPFEKLVEELQPERDLSRDPLVQVIFDLHNIEGSTTLRLGELTSQALETDSGTTKADLTLIMEELGDRLTGTVMYATDLFEAGTIERLIGHFQTLLEGIIAQPQARLADLPLLSEAERRQLLVEWNATASGYPADSPIHSLFAAQAARSPDAIAVEDHAARLTYRELDQRANQLAHELRARGIGRETRVGICLERSTELLVALLGVLKAGAAYVPLDPHFPQERLAFMLQDAQVALLLTTREQRTKNKEQSTTGRKGVLHTPPADHERAYSTTPPADHERAYSTTPPADHERAYSTTPPADHGQPTVIELDTDWSTIARQPTTEPQSDVSGEDLAYVIYTSGSTGLPKGVMVRHRSLTNFLCTMREQPGLSADDTLLALTTLSFDIAGLELYLPLLVGARLVLATTEEGRDPMLLQQRLTTSGATVLQATPTTWRLLLTGGWEGDAQLTALCGGEALPPDLAEQVRTRTRALWNLYGPTETTIWSTGQLVEAETPLSIGRPIANTEVYVLDREMRLLPTGVAGELYIGGDGLARGYHNRPELTAERFVPNPFTENKEQRTKNKELRGRGGEGEIAQSPISERLYRTGDLARFRPDGTLEYLGRIDGQVKLRGFRIELGEIEVRLRQHPQVREAAVVLRADVAGDARLVAYVVPNQEQRTKPVLSEVEGNKEQRGEEFDSQFSILNSQFLGELRAFLQPHLPEYMLPSAFVMLDALPLTPNGKLDRRRLPQPELDRAELKQAFVAPRTPLETDMAAIWGQVLGRATVGVHDNFFVLGGHSLLATQVMTRVRDTFEVELPLRVLFEAPTIAVLAERIVAHQLEQANQDVLAQFLGEIEQLSALDALLELGPEALNTQEDR